MKFKDIKESSQFVFNQYILEKHRGRLNNRPYNAIDINSGEFWLFQPDDYVMREIANRTKTINP